MQIAVETIQDTETGRTSIVVDRVEVATCAQAEVAVVYPAVLATVQRIDAIAQ